MKCPVCNDVNLRIAERQGVEIDYCPECRGVWLDRGELDKVIERSLHVENSARAQPRTSTYSDYDDNERERRTSKHSDYEESERGRPTSRHSDYDDDKHGKPKKKRGFLDDLFDFD
jgi:uncharacterized protein